MRCVGRWWRTWRTWRDVRSGDYWADERREPVNHASHYVGSAPWWTEVVLKAPLHASPMLPTPMSEEGADP